MFVCGECGQRYERAGYCAADGRPLVASDDPLLGTDIGRYRLASLIGEGGMGRVYRAVQPQIGSRVAIKVLADQCARNPELLERFFAEAKAVNLIRHENIVSVIDMARLEDGRPFIVMEFVEGKTLHQLVHEPSPGGTPLGGVVQVLGEVLSALAAAHDIGIVHRDLKPDNVLVTVEGHAKVLDFGIAKLAPGLSHLSPRTKTGALLGTPAYMAPEQISGGRIDPRTDVYAAGIVLYEAVTGRVPFRGETLFDLMREHMEAAPQPPAQLRADLPASLEQVILTALAKPPELRFQTAAAMASALHHAAADLPDDQWRALSSRGGMITGGGRATLASGRRASFAAAAQHRPRTPSQRDVATVDLGPGFDATAIGRPMREAPAGVAAMPPLPGHDSTRRMRPSRPSEPALPGHDSTRRMRPSEPVLHGRDSQPAADVRPSEPAVVGVQMAQVAPSRKRRTGLAIGIAATVAIGGGITALVVAQGGSSASASSPIATSGAPTTSSASNAPAASTATATTTTTSPSTPAPSPSTPSPAATTEAPTTSGTSVASGVADAAAAPRTSTSRKAPSTSPAKAKPAPEARVAEAEQPPVVAATTSGFVTPGLAPGNPSVVRGNNVTAGPGVGPAPVHFTRPPDFSPRAFDGLAYAPKALALARSVFPDAGLTEIDIRNVFPDGHADLTLPDGSAEYLFRSPSHSAPPAGMPSNIAVEIECYVEVTATASGVSVRVRHNSSDDKCQRVLRPIPRCSPAAIWGQARTKGAKTDTVAKVKFLFDGKWWFDNQRDGTRDGLATSFADSCP